MAATSSRPEDCAALAQPLSVGEITRWLGHADDPWQQRRYPAQSKGRLP